MADELQGSAGRNARLDGLSFADEHLRRAFLGEEFLLFDGGMGSMLQEKGLLQPGDVPELLNLSAPDKIAALQAGYVAAGAEVITANTFGANARKLDGRAGVAEVFAAAASCARAAGARYVAADLGPIGELLEPLGTLSFDDAYALFAEQVDAAVAAGCDLILIETLTDLFEAKAAVLAAREHSELPVIVSMTFEEDGRTFLGTPPEVAASALSSLGANAVGMNCSVGPAEALPFVKQLVRFAQVPVIVQPNAGLPRIQDGKTVYDVSAADFSQAMEGIAEQGASMLGGCCGTTPEMIERVVATARRLGAPRPRPQIDACVLTSGQQAVVLETGRRGVAAIGERINPTGKPRLKEALRNGDMDYLMAEAVTQCENGAKLLDVNVGLPEIDEPSVLEAAVRKLQSTTTAPLVLDSSDPAALERACRTYNGKALVNSVNGKRENLDAVLPIVARYGCAVIGLCLDEDGIPPTREGRFAIAERIVAEAAVYGIPANDVVIDCLTMAVATNQSEAVEILEAIKLVKSRLGCRTALGVSNISFGLPQRNLMSSSFLAAALGAGLDLPIINPSAARYRDVLRCFEVISGQDAGAVSYIEHCRNVDDPYDAPQGARVDEGKMAQALALIAEATGMPGAAAGASAPASQDRVAEPAGEAASELPIPEGLSDAAALAAEVQQFIFSGRDKPVADATEKLLEGHDPLLIIDGLFIPTLDEVGLRFDRGEFFLPQLMASAEAVKAGFDVVKARMAASGEAQQARDDKPVMLATVKGDIHDIGKNIVKMLLENYGYRVVDLGRDVAPERVVEAARDQGIGLVGLSALMTTTVKAMEETIKLLHEQVPGAKVFVGGAVLTPEYASTIDADWYAKDAAASARIAEEFFAAQVS